MSLEETITKVYDGCVHCIPTTNGKSKPLMKNTYNHKSINSQGSNIIERLEDIVVINRVDKLENTFVLRNVRTIIKNIESSPYVYKKTTTLDGAPILFCPCCGRHLADPIEANHPLKQRALMQRINKKPVRQSKSV